MKPSDPQLRRLLKLIGNNIKKIRQESDLTQEQIDGRGFSYRWLQYIEAGHRNVNVSTLQKIAKALKVPISEFFKDAK